MLGTKFYKGQFDNKDYAECAIWCNKNNATIKDMGEYYECVEIEFPLFEVKEAKIAELKARRNSEELSPIEYNGVMWDFDDDAQKRIQGAIIALGDEGTITWTSADNEEIENVTKDILTGVVKEAAIRSNVLHIKYRTLKDKVEKCRIEKTVREIEW